MVNVTRNNSVIADAEKCNPLGIDQFPSSIFSEYQRDHGAILLHIGAAIYFFGALGYLCDQYFVPLLEFLVERFKIKPDVAGATIMVIANCIPELTVSMIGMFVSKDDVGLGAVVGSALFNIFFISGCCVLAAPSGSLRLQPYPIIRDSLYYLVAMIPAGVIAWDQQVSWTEAMVLVILYCGYMLLMYFNNFVEEKVVDYFPSLHPKCNYHCHNGEVTPLLFEKSSEENGTYLQGKTETDPEKTVLNAHDKNSCRSQVLFLDGDATPLLYEKSSEEKETYLRDKNEGDREITMLNTQGKNSCCSPFLFPKGTFRRILWLMALPLIIIFALTIPNPKQDCSKKLYLITFFMCVIYVGLFCYLLVWMMTIIGYAIGIPEIVLGLVILSAGSSFPDVVECIIVTRHEKANMALSNCIVSNIFDILIGLGFPWIVKAAVFGNSIQIYSGSIHFTILILVGAIIVVNVVFIVNKWTLRWPAGLILLILYTGSITTACLLEMNLLGKYNRSTCGT